MTDITRVIDIDSCYNLRDTGGYPANGGTTRWRTLLRSASPHRMPAESWDGLHDLGVRTLIDLRRGSEATRESYAAALHSAMRYQSLPLFDDDQYETVDRPAYDLPQLYQRLLVHCGDKFATVLRTIASDPGPVLVHCAVGKDRTGMVIALALSAVGVAPATIADDYALSNALLDSLFGTFRVEVRDEFGDLDRLERFLESKRETMIDTLAHIDDEYGSVGSYLERIGLEADAITALHHKLVVAPE